MKLDEIRVANNHDLFPCPHCGEHANLYLAYRLDASGKPDRAPYCIDCIGCGHEFVPREGSDVVAAWNRRNDAAAAEILRLRVTLEECEEFFYKRADADQPAGSSPIPNAEMRMLMIVRDALKGETR